MKANRKNHIIYTPKGNVIGTVSEGAVRGKMEIDIDIKADKTTTVRLSLPEEVKDIPEGDPFDDPKPQTNLPTMSPTQRTNPLTTNQRPQKTPLTVDQNPPKVLPMARRPHETTRNGDGNGASEMRQATYLREKAASRGHRAPRSDSLGSGMRRLADAEEAVFAQELHTAIGENNRVAARVPTRLCNLAVPRQAANVPQQKLRQKECSGQDSPRRRWRHSPVLRQGRTKPAWQGVKISREVTAVAAVAAVLTVSAYSGERIADIDGVTLMSKVSLKLSSDTQKGDKIFTRDGVLTASIDFEVKAPSSGGIKEGRAKGDLKMKVDFEKYGITIKVKGDLEDKAFKDVSKGMSDRGSGSIEAYGEKTNDGGYRMYSSVNDKQWKYASVGKSDYQSFPSEVQKPAKQQSDNFEGKIDKSMNDAKQYADIDIRESGDDYITTVTPKDVVINQLVSQAGKEGVEINKNDAKVKLIVTTRKSDYSLRELKVDVDIKSMDDKFSLRGGANMKIEEKDVSIDVPKSAKNGTSAPSQELLGFSSSKAFSQD